MAHNPIRLGLFVSVLIGLFGLLALRAAHLQIQEGSYFLALADENRFYSLTIPAARGAILDRYQHPLAYNRRRYFHLNDTDALYAQSEPVTESEGLALLSTASAEVVLGSQRQYHFPVSLAHILGYVGQVTAEDLAANPTLRLDQQLGKSGMELAYQTELRGRDGKALYEINALAERQRLVRQEPPVDGQTLETTLDPYLSELAYQALGNVKGTVIISDAETGALLTLVNKPSFDANVLAQVALDQTERASRQAQIKGWTTDPDQPFFNRAVAGAYPPGSVFKLVTALAGLEQGKLDLTTTVLDEGVLKVGDFAYANWYYTQFGGTEGEIGLVRALARSNDIFFYKAAEWVGPTVLANTARLVGLGQAPGLGLGSEATGTVPDPAWKERVIGEPWYLGNTYHFGIGQGDVLVSPLQMNQLVQAFANRGTQCRPWLVDAIGNKKIVADCHEVGVSEDHLNTVLEGMIQACSAGGTAYPLFPHNQEYFVEASPQEQLEQGMIACKTGTAEFGSADQRGYRPTHGWFVAVVEPHLSVFEPTPTSTNSAEIVSSATESAVVAGVTDEAEDSWRAALAIRPLPKRLVITVLVESDKTVLYREGSRDAAPVALTIINQLFN